MLRKILDEIQYVMDQVTPYLDEVEQEDIIVKRVNHIVCNDMYNNKVLVKHEDVWYEVNTEKFLMSYRIEIKPVNGKPITFNVLKDTIYTFYNGTEDVFQLKGILDKVIRVIRKLPEIKAQQEQERLMNMEKEDIKLRKARLLSNFIQKAYEMD